MGFLRLRPSRFGQSRRSLRTLERIATALEEQNRLTRALYPEVEQRLAHPARVESQVSYVDPAEQLYVEQLRMDLVRKTGKLLTDDELVAYIEAEGVQVQ